MSDTLNFTPAEKEIVFLKAAAELIDLMVNHDMIILSRSSEGSQATFKTGYHQKIFIILLLDFLSRANQAITGKGARYLEALNDICKNPIFNTNNSIQLLNTAVTDFSSWLSTEINIRVWSAKINKETLLKITREELINICGNTTKHSFSRLSKVLELIRKVYARSGEALGIEESLLVLDDCYDRFFDDVISYQASSIVEHLNNIRWGIHEYLRPHHSTAIVYDNTNISSYRYEYPPDIKNKFAQYCYWELRNKVGMSPYINRFKTYDIMTKRY